MAGGDGLGNGKDLVATLSATAREMNGSRMQTEEETLSQIVRGAVQTVPGAEHAGVSLLQGDGRITSYTPSSETVSEIDQLQSTYSEGPCVTALWDEHMVVVDDLEQEAWRWPRFAPDAASRGVTSMLSFQLFARTGTLGALNLYSGERKRFAAQSQLLGELFASHAALALGGARHVAELRQALSTRDVIGQAKGILMERFGFDPEDAFSMLVRSSQETNMKLVDVAHWLTGDAAGGAQ